jgi:di/tricarboxylate transporter
MGFFELAPVGLVFVVFGMAYMLLIAPRLLPDRQQPSEQLGEHRREYTASMIVEPGCPLIDQTVEQAGLRHLPGLFLVEIDRLGHTVTPVSPDDTIREADGHRGIHRLAQVSLRWSAALLEPLRGLPVAGGAEPRSDEPETLLRIERVYMLSC